MIGRKSNEEISYLQRTQMAFNVSTAIMYEQYIEFTIVQPHGLLKPMESKTFTFSFRSADKPGMFFEEWELITDPQTYHKLPSFYLSGMATLNDDKR